MVTVVDQMAQAIHQKQGVGYEAYVARPAAGKIALPLVREAAAAPDAGGAGRLGLPDFSGAIKISALDIESLVRHRCAWVRRLVPPIYVSGKWVNYMGILMGLAFDWGYWFMTSLPFRPCDHAALGQRLGSIYTLTQPKKLQEEHGRAAALNCAWFTDSPVQQLYDRPYATVARRPTTTTRGRTSPTPHVVLVETGSFTGAYTIDEEDNYATSPAAPGSCGSSRRARAPCCRCRCLRRDGPSTHVATDLEQPSTWAEPR
ncbi:hypothetical protein JL720_12705 [Aureococcus anophagefferens]|nr:hypothetical protein JL720_12705 [Aureococcus anophagefferens]